MLLGQDFYLFHQGKDLQKGFLTTCALRGSPLAGTSSDSVQDIYEKPFDKQACDIAIVWDLFLVFSDSF